MPAMTFYPGTITREQTVWCWHINNRDSGAAALVDRYRAIGDDCEQHHQEAGPVAGVARRSGWVKHRRYGWTCAACNRAMKKVPAGAWLSLVDE